MRLLLQRTAVLKHQLITWGVNQSNQINAKTVLDYAVFHWTGHSC